MTHIAVIGAGIAGVTTAFQLLERGMEVTVIDRQRYAAMETSFANGGQLSASNAEVWTNWATVLKGLKWMMQRDAPLLVHPRPTLHKISWMAEFLGSIPKYKSNTIDTVRMAVAGRAAFFDMAERAGIDFDHASKGILHFYKSDREMAAARKVSALLAEGGLDRQEVTPAEMHQIEPALQGDFAGGFLTPSDSTGDIHKFSVGLAAWLARQGVHFALGKPVHDLRVSDDHVEIDLDATHRFDGVVIAAGVGSRWLARKAGDRVNVYPVKGYSITVNLDDAASQAAAPQVSLLDDKSKIVTSRLGASRFRVAGTAEFTGENRDIRQDRIAPLTGWVERHFPGVSTETVVPWAGLRPMMPNMMPRLGQGRSERVFYNTGHGHLGWTLSGATSAMVAQSVAAAFRPDRNAVQSGPMSAALS